MYLEESCESKVGKVHQDQIVEALECQVNILFCEEWRETRPKDLKQGLTWLE